MPIVTTRAGGCAIVIITGSAERRHPTRTERFVCLFYRWGPHRERESRAVRMDVQYVFAPLFTQPLVALYVDGKGTAGAPPMSHDGQIGQDQQAVVGDFYVLDQMGSQDQDPAAPRTHRVTGHDFAG